MSLRKECYSFGEWFGVQSKEFRVQSLKFKVQKLMFLLRTHHSELKTVFLTPLPD